MLWWLCRWVRSAWWTLPAVSGLTVLARGAPGSKKEPTLTSRWRHSAKSSLLSLNLWVTSLTDTSLSSCHHHMGQSQQTMYPDACSRVWTRATVLDGHGGVCVITYRQVSSMFSSTYHALALPLDRDPFLSQLHIRWLSTFSTFNRHLNTYVFMTAYSCYTT